MSPYPGDPVRPRCGAPAPWDRGTRPATVFDVKILPPAEGCRRVRVTGEVDATVAAVLLAAILDPTGQADLDTIEIDLTAVTFLDAAGVNALLAARGTLLAREQCLRVRGVQGSPRRVLEITGLLGPLGGKADHP